VTFGYLGPSVRTAARVKTDYTVRLSQIAFLTQEVQVSEKNAQADSLRVQLAVATLKVNHLTNRNREFELALATMQAKLDAQQGFTAGLRAYLDARDHPPDSGLSVELKIRRKCKKK
jgi:hypothetical protein